MALQILLVDDQPSVRNGIRSLLGSRPDWKICGEASDGLEGVEKARQLQPDLVLMDVSMPRMNGLDAIRILRAELPQTKIVIVSQNDPAIVSIQAREVNASGHVAKQELFGRLLPVLDSLLGYQPEQERASAETTPESLVLPNWLTGSGELGELIRRFDWSKTPLGAIENWNQSLKTSINLMLSSQHPMWIGWGPDATFLYNDAYIQVLGSAKHPWALGKPAAEVWSEIWDICGPMADKVFEEGEASFVDEVRLFMNRGDFFEETYYSYSYSPIRDESGSVGGLFCVSTEVTPKVINARRLRTLSELSANALVQKTTEAACASAVATLSKNPDDIPFALLYMTATENEQLRLQRACGLDPGVRDLSPLVIEMAAGSGYHSLWPLAEVIRSVRSRVVPISQVEGFPLGTAEQPLSHAIVLPVTSRGEGRPVGVLIAGVNPTRRLDAEYSTFFDLVTDQVATAIQNARAAEEEQKRLEALAELDRAKTAFFSNVSHEFRTPLTLMLGPVEELLAKSHTDLSPAAKSQLELVNRSGSRLLRLVNTLLDFSRLEAGRMLATYQATDLPAFTAELASVFRSATEKAGLELKLDCPPSAEPVYVDPLMWEKIVLNLVSNAFKFTFEGKIEVSLARAGRNVELRVSDSGVGIPQEELPRVFNRFHRIENTRSRTHEGSGIGLALVQELVKLHGGSIEVESTVGKGTTFTVSIPLGKDHLPVDRIRGGNGEALSTRGATPFVEEALRWLPDAAYESILDAPEAAAPASANEGVSENAEVKNRPAVLVVDDNADMRHYLVRLLSERYDVRSAPNGEAALASIRENAPALVLTDVMMPRLDGFGLIRELRADPDTKTIPVIVLSARAGEESRVEGMEQGADDYLIKPFSARELLARVNTHLQMSRIRNESEEAIIQKQQQLSVALEASNTGTFRWDPRTGEFLALDENFKRLFGLPAGESVESFSEVMARVHPEDRSAVVAAVEACRTGADFDMEYRVVLPDGEVLWLYDRARALRDDDGNVVCVVGACTDVSRRKGFELEALAANAKFRAVFDQTTVFSGVLSTAGVVLDANRLCLDACGYRAEEVIGKPFWKTPWWQGSQEVQNKIKKACAQAAKGARYREELPYHWAEGSERLVEFELHPVRDDRGRIIFLHPSGVDVTDVKRTRENYRTLADNISQFAWMANSSGWMYWFNQRWFDYTGTALDQVQGWGWQKAVHPDHVLRVVEKIKGSFASGDVWEDTFPLRGKDGEYRWFLSRAVPIKNAHGRITRWFGTNTDVTELRNTQDALRKSKEFTEEQVRVRTRELEARNAKVVQQSEQLRELSHKMLQMQDDERRHVARELHDSAGQILAALGMNLAHVVQVAQQSAPQVVKGLNETRQFVDQLSKEIRTMSYLLHPPLLDESGLPIALRWYAEGLAERSGLQISVNIPEDLGRFGRDMELMMFRLVQECLTNIHRHSGSKTADITVWSDDRVVGLDIQDRGKGIPPDRLASIQAQGGGVGIRGMRERIHPFQGTMEIESNASGTKTSFRIPLQGASLGNERADQPLQISA
ncbi:MAG TPA: response regulator [Terriglobales bacterium]|nr:response regulator [Terriglobales bacterium]